MKKNFASSAWVGLLFSAVVVGLMFYALGRNPNALPSQLVGKPAPLFSASASNGALVSLDTLLAEKRWTVVNFWSTSCVVCREEAPEWQRVFNASQAPMSKLQFVSVNIQEEQALVLRYLKDFSLNFPAVLDASGKISLDYGVTGTPETFFIDPQGVVRHRVAGAIDSLSVFRFVDWLEKNPVQTPEEAARSYSGVLSGRGQL